MKLPLASLLIILFLIAPQFSTACLGVFVNSEPEESSPFNLTRTIKSFNKGDQTQREDIIHWMHHGLALPFQRKLVDIDKLFPTGKFDKFSTAELFALQFIAVEKKVRLPQLFVEEIIKRTEQNDISAQIALAFLYSSGWGVPEDLNKAFNLYKEAAEKQNAISQVALGEMYYFGAGIKQDYFQAFQWTQKAALQGHGVAQNNLGKMYYFETGVDPDINLAFYWYQKAAYQGLAAAQCNLGRLYYEGKGVEQSYELAFKWTQKAALQGHAEAQNRLGMMYYLGEGIEQDYALAFKWRRKAALQGYATAQHNLAMLYYEGKGITQNYSLALEWLHHAALGGIEPPQTQLKDFFKPSQYTSQFSLSDKENKEFINYFVKNFNTLRDFYFYILAKSSASGFKDIVRPNPFVKNLSKCILSSIQDIWKVLYNTKVPGFLVSSLEVKNPLFSFTSHTLDPNHPPFISWIEHDLLKRVKEEELFRKVQAFHRLTVKAISILKTIKPEDNLFSRIFDPILPDLFSTDKEVYNLLNPLFERAPRSQADIQNIIKMLRTQSNFSEPQSQPSNQEEIKDTIEQVRDQMETLKIQSQETNNQENTDVKKATIERAIKILETTKANYLYLSPFFDNQPRSQTDIDQLIKELEERAEDLSEHEAFLQEFNIHLFDYLIKTEASRNNLFKKTYPWLFVED